MPSFCKRCCQINSSRLLFHSIAPFLLSLDRGSSATHLALARSFVVVVIDPAVQIDLKLVDVSIDLFAKRDLVKFLQYRFMETHRKCHWFVGA